MKMHTYDDWLNLGYMLRDDAVPVDFNEYGEGLYSEDQLVNDYDEEWDEFDYMSLGETQDMPGKW